MVASPSSCSGTGQGQRGWYHRSQDGDSGSVIMVEDRDGGVIVVNDSGVIGTVPESV